MSTYYLPHNFDLRERFHSRTELGKTVYSACRREQTSSKENCVYLGYHVKQHNSHTLSRVWTVDLSKVLRLL